MSTTSEFIWTLRDAYIYGSRVSGLSIGRLIKNVCRKGYPKPRPGLPTTKSAIFAWCTYHKIGYKNRPKPIYYEIARLKHSGMRGVDIAKKLGMTPMNVWNLYNYGYLKKKRRKIERN